MNDSNVNQNNYSTCSRSDYEKLLQILIFMTEKSMDVRGSADASEKHVCNLRKMVENMSRDTTTLRNGSKDLVLVSRKFTSSLLKNLKKMCSETLDSELENVRHDYERLAKFLDKEMTDIDGTENLRSDEERVAMFLDKIKRDIDGPENIYDFSPTNHSTGGQSAPSIAERLRNLEMRQFAERNCNLPPTLSARSFRSDVDEKYPDNWSKDSSISLNNVVNLPPVPEDAFTSFSRPTRTSSLSSLKSIRKVKLFLQRTVTSEDEESECDDHELSMSDDPPSSSEGGETRSVALSVKKVRGLCNIKEETPQDP